MGENPENPSSSASDAKADENAALRAALARVGSILDAGGADGIPVTTVERDEWRDLARQLRDDPDLCYEMLVDVAAVDWLERDPRFEVVVHLWSLAHNRMLRVKVPVPETDATCPSVTALWPTANWHEREAFDLMGIHFDGHPDLRRILMPEDYPFHPLQKDFPNEGIDNSVSYRNQGGVLMSDDLVVNRPAGLDSTPVDLSRGDPEGYTDGAEELAD